MKKQADITKRNVDKGLLSPFEKAVVTHHAVTGHRIYEDTAVGIVNGTFNDSADAYTALQLELFDSTQVPFPGPRDGEESFTFIDLFAGIGGFRMALQQLGGRCLFSSEYDKFAQKTYFANFGEVPFGDITKERTKEFIPEEFDVLCAGFPCQPFSIAGVSKKISLGRNHGFADEKQGNLFFHIAEIIERHRPRVFFLENVKNLVSHDKGNTFRVIKQTLEELDYSFDYRVINGKHFVPQHRERTFMIGFDKERYGDDVRFDFGRVEIPEGQQQVGTILQSRVDPKYTLSDKLWSYLQDYARKHKEKGNGFGYGLISPDGITRTISARYYKDGSEILIPQRGRNPRRLTPLECAALQGYPIHPINSDNPSQSFVIPVSDNQAYKQFGNSVVVPLIHAIGAQVINQLEAHEQFAIA